MAKDAAKPIRLSGVDVCFPHDPYGVQKVFMSQVVRAVDHEENALLEAPTGCGKTLSLLCGALAWQTSIQAKRAAAEQAAARKLTAAEDTIEDSQDEASPAAAAPAKERPAEPPQEPIMVPKIYYATRTHSQIAQVVRELKRTIYKPKMAVLGARPHYCINAAVTRKGNIDGECEELLKDGMGCKYKRNANNVFHGHVKVHDIEDLVKIGKSMTACPYFVARHLADSAELIFCPYSYLLDPNIRRSTRINAADAILIFDEAHNIEDQAREAGTMEVELDTLKSSVMSLVVAANSSSEGDTYRELSDALLQLINWLLALADGNAAGAPGQGFKQAGFESFERIWTGQQMLSALQQAGLGPHEVEHLWACYEKAKAAEDKAGFNTEGEAALEPVPATVKTPRAGGNALGCISSLLTVLRLMYGTYTEAPAAAAGADTAAGPGTGPGQAAARAAAAGGSTTAGANGAAAAAAAAKVVQSVPGVDHVGDYRLAVQMWLPRDSNHNNRNKRDRRRAEPNAASFADVIGGVAASTTWAFRFCLWCLNPAVVFRSLSSVARSVLLTSGTLSPLDSFSGELGLDFHVRLEAPHVVDVNKQVFARVVSQGLDGRRLRATYKEADQLAYQDSLGQLVLGAASTVPDGLLLFLPSYALMEKLSKRWQDTGLMTQLQSVKAVFSEPRQAGDAFDTAIKRFYEAVDKGQGGLFMAVCRGKVSEGIDFADGRARCVMVVGIPYPHAKDSKVALKKDYNNATAAASARAGAGAAAWPGAGGSSGSRAGPPRLLTGDAWYSQQAFRALNQAIGRCIRHRLDYGAILLVDERFKEPRNQSSLSKWVRGAMQPAATTQALLQDMSSFFAGLAAAPPGASASAAAAAAAPPGPLGQQLLLQEAVWRQLQQQLGILKPGYKSEPGAACAGAGLSRPGFEAGSSSGAGAVGQACCGAAGGSKPGYEPCATGVGCSSAAARSNWQQPQMLPVSKQPWQQQQHPAGTKQPHQQQPPAGAKQPQQQQQQKPQADQRQPRISGPMDAFLVKATGMQQQQQHAAAPKQQQVQQPQQPQQQPPQHGAQNPWQQEPQHQQHPAQQQHQHNPQQTWQQHQHPQPVSCLTTLQGPPACGAAPQQQQNWQQQQQPLVPLDTNVPGTPAAQGSKAPQQPDGSNSRDKQPTSGFEAPNAAAGTQQPPGPPGQAAGCRESAAHTGATDVAETGHAAPGACGADVHMTDAFRAGAAAPAATAGGREAGVCATNLQQHASSLGLSPDVLQQWVAADMSSMVGFLQQQAAAATTGVQLQELACFGIMASFDKALEVCQQQQQHGGYATCNLAPFWQVWHSCIPTGLLAAAAAAGQAAPPGALARGSVGQWHGPWLNAMQQQGLQHNLAAMAGLYDQVIEQQMQQEGVQQQQQPQRWPDPSGCHQPLQPQQPLQQPTYQQQQPFQQQQPLQHQQQQVGLPHSMPPPASRQQRSLPQSLQPPQQQHYDRPLQQQQQHGGGGGGSSTAGGHNYQDAPLRFSGSRGQVNTGASGAGAAAAGGGGGGSDGGSCRAVAPGARPQLKLQLSQSAQQPKRAAVMSAKAQLAAQKRSKVAAGQGAARQAPPAADSSSDDDDDFL